MGSNPPPSSLSRYLKSLHEGGSSRNRVVQRQQRQSSSFLNNNSSTPETPNDSMATVGHPRTSQLGTQHRRTTTKPPPREKQHQKGIRNKVNEYNKEKFDTTAKSSSNHRLRDSVDTNTNTPATSCATPASAPVSPRHTKHPLNFGTNNIATATSPQRRQNHSKHAAASTSTRPRPPPPRESLPMSSLKFHSMTTSFTPPPPPKSRTFKVSKKIQHRQQQREIPPPPKGRRQQQQQPKPRVMTGDNKNKNNKTATTKAKRKKKQEKRVMSDHDKNKSGNTLSSSYKTNPSVPATTINYNMEDNNISNNKHQEPPPLSSLQRAMKQQLNNINNNNSKNNNKPQEAVQQRMKKKLNNNQQTSVARSKASSDSLLSKSTGFYSRNQPVHSKAPSHEESVELSKSTTTGNNNPDNPNNHHRNPRPRSRISSRWDYKLGQTARSPSDMIGIEGLSPEQATEVVNSLSKHDFAFVKRSNGLFSYAILGFRSDEGATTLSPSHNDSMTFVLSGTGHTKTLKRWQWVESVRLVNMENVCVGDPELPPVVTTNIASAKRDESKDPKPAARGSDDGNNNNNEENREEERSDAKAEVREDYFNKLRTEFYRTRGPPTVGEVPPDMITFDMTEDDLISCVSTQLEDNDEDLETAKYTPSQPVILE